MQMQLLNQVCLIITRISHSLLTSRNSNKCLRGQPTLPRIQSLKLSTSLIFPRKLANYWNSLLEIIVINSLLKCT